MWGSTFSVKMLVLGGDRQKTKIRWDRWTDSAAEAKQHLYGEEAGQHLYGEGVGMTYDGQTVRTRNSIRRHHFEVEEDHDSQKEVLECVCHGQRVTEKKESSF